MAFGFGIADALGHPEVSQYIDPRRNMLLGLAAGLVGGPNWSQGLSSGFQMAAQGGAVDRAAAEKAKADELAAKQTAAARTWFEKNAPQYVPMIDSGMSVGQAWNQYFGDASGGAGNRVTYGVTPIYGMDTRTGTMGYGVQGSDGSFKLVDTGGFQPLSPYELNANRAAGSAWGAQTGGAQFSVPNAELELDQSKAAISKVTDPDEKDIAAGKEDWFKQWGALPRGMWVQGGSNMAKFRNAAVNVIDRSWLSARAALKGAGQITDYESNKAENAVSAMKSALDSGDKASYDAAVADYEYWIKQGFEKMKQQAGAIPGYGGGGAGAGAGGGVEDLVTKYLQGQ